MNWLRLTALAGAVVVMALLLPDSVAVAASARLSVSASAGRNGAVLVEARLSSADGKPLGSQPVSLWLGNSFFSGRPARLGTEQTDSAGAVTFVFEPSWVGEQKLEARFAGDGQYEKAAVTVAYTATAVPPAANGHGAGETPLAPIWQLVGFAAAVVTFSIWAILIGTLVWVRSGIRHLSARPGPAAAARDA